MKKQILAIGAIVLFAFGSTLFVSCNNSEHHDGEHMEHHDGEHAMYQCPMKCEGDKMYEEPGQCPQCGMDLEEVKES